MEAGQFTLVAYEAVIMIIRFYREYYIIPILYSRLPETAIAPV